MSYEFKSSNENLIHVGSATSALTAKELPASKANAAVITVTTYNKKTASVKITVHPELTEITLDASKLMLGVKETGKLVAKLEPSRSFGNVTWMGTATVTANVYNKADPDHLLTADCVMTVKAAPNEENADLVPVKAKIGVGESTRLSVISDTAAGAVKSYKSKNTAVATVSKSGVVKGMKVGKSMIMATLYNDEKLIFEIEVVKAPTKVTVSNPPEGNKLTLKVGESWTPEFEYKGYGGDDFTGLVISITNSSKAKLVEFKDGKLTALATGTVKITFRPACPAATNHITIAWNNSNSSRGSKRSRRPR